ncbi:MAG: hypothetical protein FJ009_21040 [Chloroflexi bacterium]|nr:hypothetical protein [Chloroflexota bacterium]
MPQWEVCRIEEDGRVESGLLSKKVLRKWIAVADTLNGKQIVEQTPEWEYVDSMGNRYRVEHEKKMHFRSVMIGRLLANGWEPIGSNERGEVVTLRRFVP